MRSALLGLALLGAAAMGTAAQAATPSTEQSLIQPVYWDGGYYGDYCGPRCQEHRWWRHQRWEARRHYCIGITANGMGLLTATTRRQEIGPSTRSVAFRPNFRTYHELRYSGGCCQS